MFFQKKITTPLIAVLISFSFFLFPGTFASAQNDSLAESLSAVVTPENPLPNTLITINLQSSLVNLATASIVWSVDGKVVQSGKDSRTLQLRLGKEGSVTKVSALVKTDTFGTLSKILTFAPTTIELLYETNSYTPPFYKGKALATSQSLITLYALPKFTLSNGTKLLSKNLIFTWKKNGSVEATASGLGKDSYAFINGMLPEDNPQIEVTVVSPENNLRGYASFIADTSTPKIIFYENSPVYGTLLSSALTASFPLTKQEVTLVAYPYFFSGKNRNNSLLIYEWTINNSPVSPSPSSKSSIVLRAPGGKGESTLGLTLQNKNKLLETNSATLSITYDQ